MLFRSISPEKIIIEKSLRLGFSATNNEAKYEALLMIIRGKFHIEEVARVARELA